MKRVLISILCLCSIVVTAQSPIGAWEGQMTSQSGVPLRMIVIFADGYQVAAISNAETGEFIHTNGGTWKLEGNTMTETVEFHTDNAEVVGTSVSFEVELTDNTLKIEGAKVVLNRIDKGNEGDLAGAWLMSGRKRDGQMQSRNTDQPRKTMKILSGTRFQWIAYNTETKQFMGTGGGSYTTENGKYTENIEFFSRDNSRVGASLEFDYSLQGGDWHHSGLSSKGNPIYEVWSIRTK